MYSPINTNNEQRINIIKVDKIIYGSRKLKNNVNNDVDKD